MKLQKGQSKTYDFNFGVEFFLSCTETMVYFNYTKLKKIASFIFVGILSRALNNEESSWLSIRHPLF